MITCNEKSINSVVAMPHTQICWFEYETPNVVNFLLSARKSKPSLNYSLATTLVQSLLQPSLLLISILLYLHIHVHMCVHVF